MKLSDFLERLRDRMRRYSGMNPDDPVAQGLLTVNFMMKAWPNIQIDIQYNRKQKGGTNNY